MKFYICVGERVGQDDDKVETDCLSLEDATGEAIRWATDDLWLDSDGKYDTVVWIEDMQSDVLWARKFILDTDGTVRRLIP